MDVFLDYNFSRNVGQVFLFLVIFFPLWFLFLILSNRRVVDHKLWNSILTTISNHRFKLMVVNDICSVFYVPILWFGFYQMQELFGEDFLVFNGISCLLFVIFAIIIPFIWLWAWVKKQPEQLQEYYGFMCSRMKDDVPGAKLQICITYWYLLLMVIWLTALYQFPVPQMVMLIATNVAYFLYMVITRPYTMPVNTIMTVVFTLLAITLQSFILYIQINNASLTGTSKSELIYPFLIVMSIVLMVFILWSLWKCIYEVMEVWRFFTKTQFYKAYADPQIEQQKQQTQQYNKYEKMAINIQPKEGDVIVDKIYKECNDQGFNVIKVRKKVLKKKKKPKTRVKHEEKKEIDEQDLQYMKVNKINAFDYDYEENFQPTKVKNTIKRTFDDDLKDAVSDEDDDFKPIKTKKQKQTHTIEVQEHQKPVQDLSNLDDGISNNQLLQDQGRVSQMSQFRKSKGFHQELEDYQSANFGQSSQMWQKNEKLNDEQNKQKPIQEIKQQQSVKDIDELLKEEESKEKKLGFLFDDFEEDQ